MARFEPNRVLALLGWGAIVVEAQADRRTRLYVRTRYAPGPATLAYMLLVEIPHFIMERKMLLGIKARAEEAVRQKRALG